MRMKRVVLLGLLMVAAFTLAVPAAVSRIWPEPTFEASADGPYRVTAGSIAGVSLKGEGEPTDVDDVIWLEHLKAVQRQLPPFMIAEARGRTGMLLDERLNPVAVNLKKDSTPEERRSFTALSSRQLRGLWGIRLECWDAEIESAVSRIDPER